MVWPKQSPKNIIIRMPNWIGDCVMATPLLADLRKYYPKAAITAMCQSNVASLIQKDPNIDEILSFKKTAGWLHGQHRDIIDPLRFGNFDLGILTTNSFSSAWWFWLGCVKNRIGYSGYYRRFLLSKALNYPRGKEYQHQVMTYKMLLVPLGIPVSETVPYVKIDSFEREEAKSLLAKYRIQYGRDIIVGINPGAAYGSAKCWLPERFIHVTRKLIELPNVKVVYFGDESAASLVSHICKDMPESVANLAGKTSLRELMALIGQCRVVLSNDSGPMHIAAALKVPLVALFGSTSKVKTGPYHHGTVIHKHISCSPCYQRTCPIDFKCMTRIQVEEVYSEIVKLIESDLQTQVLSSS